MRKSIKKALTVLTAISMAAATMVLPVSVKADPDDGLLVKVESASGGVTTGTQLDAIEEENEEDDDDDVYESSVSDDTEEDEGEPDTSDEEGEETEEAPVIWEEVHISTSEELCEFAANCRLDSWSRNKNVYLDCDISMTNIEFDGIPTFGGYFNGQGHTISGFNISSEESYLGFFSRIQGNGVVKDLVLSGRVLPEGTQTIVGGLAGDNRGIISGCSFKGSVSGEDYIGGIVGINELSGIIIDTEAEGVISGTHFTGGIAGENMGNIMRCTNRAGVNIVNKSTAMSVEDISIDSVMSMIGIGDTDKDEAEASAMVNGVVDMGGIAGVSIGVIQSCTNDGNVGYTNVGYNVGGIAGRQSGYIYACNNNGEILGRKDVGGIVGQAEPYVTVDFANDITSQLSDNIEKLHDILEVTLNNADDSSDTISSRLSIIKNFTDQALEDTRYIEDETIDWANGMTASANEALSRIDYILDESAKSGGVIDKTNDATSDAKTAMSQFESTVNDLDAEKYMSESQKADYEQAKKNIEDATKAYEEYEKEVDKTAAYNYSLLYYIGQNEYNGTSDPSNSLGKDEDDVVYQNSGVVKYKKSNSPSGVGSSPSSKGASLYASSLGTFNSDYNVDGYSWAHDDGTGTYTSLGSTSDSDQNSLDSQLTAAATSGATELIKAYADAKYLAEKGGSTTSYSSVITENAETMANILAAVTPEMTDATKSDANKALESLKSAMSDLNSAGTQAKSIINTINGKSDISLPSFSQEYKDHANSLTDNIQAMSDNFGLLNDEMNGASDTLIDDLHGVNDQFNVIMQLFTDAVDGVLDDDYSNSYNDDSLSVCEETTDATVANCVNEGVVNGSINISGIAGTMAIEYDFDLESDVTGIKDAAKNTTYQTKCVLRKNTNRGEVTAVKNYAGGICGLQEMGTITGCENYNTITSDTASYVGGITGSSVSNIIKSYAKCTLSGKSYVGGIAGDGIKIYDCLTMVQIQDAVEWYGAIAGHASDTSKIKNNYFCGSDLAGIDRVSYAGCAEPISYSYAREKFSYVPSYFDQVYVTFVYTDEDDDGEEYTTLIEKRTYEYGQAVALDEYPDPPEREGYYASWDREGIDAILYDETVTAEYVRNNTTLAGDIVRGSNQSALLVDGQFKSEDALFAVLSVGQPDAMEGCKEYWDVSIPDDGLLNHQIRYMKADNMDKWPDIYVSENGGGTWREITEDDLGEMGAYKTFNVSGNEVKIQTLYSDAKAQLIKKILIIAGCILTVVILVLIQVVIVKNRKRVHKRVQKRAQALREKSAAREPAIKFIEEEDLDNVDATEEADILEGKTESDGAAKTAGNLGKGTDSEASADASKDTDAK